MLGNNDNILLDAGDNDSILLDDGESDSILLDDGDNDSILLCRILIIQTLMLLTRYLFQTLALIS